MAALGRTGLSGCTAASRMRTLPTLPARISLSCWVLFSSAVYSSVFTRTSRTSRTTSCSRSGNCLMLLPMRFTSPVSEAICRSMARMLG